MKKFISVILAFIIAFSCMACMGVCSFAGDSAVLYFGGKDVDSKDSDKAVTWWKAENGEYFLFVPSYWDASALKVWAKSEIKKDGQVVAQGEETDLGTSGTLTIDGANYKYNVIASSGVGSIFIETESHSLDAIHASKENKEKGSIYIYDAKGKCQTLVEDDDGNKTENNKLDQIKGRGNQTWQYDKRPYNIKLNKKCKVFGMQKSKKWCLIANVDDATLMRNAIAYAAAAEAGMPYSPEYAPTDLYINNEYKGSYLLTSKIEADSKRIDVENLDDVNEEICLDKYGEDFNMDDLARGGVYGKYSGLLENTLKYVEIPETEDSTTVGGYILEMELANRYADEISGFVTSNSQPLIMKEPEYASKAQMEFISDYYQRFENAVISKTGKNDKGEAYTDLANLESLAKYYTMSEWFSNMDSGLTSSYFYLDSSKDGILYAGPVWDYDIAFGSNRDKRYGLDYTNPEQFTVCFGRMYRDTIFGSFDASERPTIYNLLAQKPEFVKACKEYWDADIYAVATDWCGDKFNDYAAQIKDSAIMNHIRWNTFGTSSPAEVSEKIDSAVEYLNNFIAKRTAFLNANLGTVQTQSNATSAFKLFGKKILVGINNAVEYFIRLFHLENK